MFYKNEYLNSQEISEFLHSPEFCQAIYEKMKILPSTILVDIHCHDQDGNIVQSFPVPALTSTRNSDNEGRIKSFITIKGNYTFYTSSSFSERYFIEKLNKQYQSQSVNEIVKLSHNEISYADFTKKYTLDSDKLHRAQKILDNFFNLEKEGIIFDKNKDPYYYQIVQNSDINIGENIIIDELFLYKIKDNIKDTFIGKKITPAKLKLINHDSIEAVGYLKSQYTTPEIVELLEKKLNENYPQVTTPVTIKNKNKPKEVSPFLNVASIDYSYLNDPYKNKGLGYAMYFHMAKHLNSKNIEFRQSSLNSEYATRLWEGMQKHWKNNVTLKPFMNNNLCFLSIGEDSILAFKNSKPVIMKKKIKI